MGEGSALKDKLNGENVKNRKRNWSTTESRSKMKKKKETYEKSESLQDESWKRIVREKQKIRWKELKRKSEKQKKYEKENYA